MALLTAAPSALAESIEFSARHMTVSDEQVELSGDVDLRYSRYGLRSQRLRVRRDADGVQLEGPVRLRGCPCTDPPIELEFESAEIKDDGSISLIGPRLVSGGIPLFYWPQLSLAARDRVGVLPPRIEYRGPDGLFAGLGLDVPLLNSAGGSGRGLDGDTGTRARVGVGGYTRFRRPADGLRLDVDVSGPAGRSAVAWETLDGGMLDVDAHGANTSAARVASENANLAWRVDALRGQRGLRAPGSLIRVAMPEDRVRAAVSHFGAPLYGYAQFRADSARGSPGVDDAQAGAALGASRRFSLLPALTLGLSADVLGLSGDHLSRAALVPSGASDGSGASRALGLWVQRAELTASSPVGPLSLSSGMRAQAASARGGAGAAAGAGADPQLQGEVQLAAGLPLARRFGAARHVVTPEVTGELVLGGVGTAQLDVAVRQRLGGAEVGYAMQLNVSAGVGERLSQGPERQPLAERSSLEYYQGEMLLDSRWVAGRAWGVVRREQPQTVGDAPTEGAAVAGEGSQWALISSLRVGRDTQTHAELGLAQQSDAGWGADDPAARLSAGALGGALDARLRPDAWRSPLDAGGWSGSGLLVLPLGSQLAFQLASAWDLSALGQGDRSGGLLFGALAAGYRHPCGCLSLRAELSHRQGRHLAFVDAAPSSLGQLFDASIQVELFE